MPPAFSSNSCRDRTAEFLSVVERLQKLQGGPSTSGSYENAGARQGSGKDNPQSEFAKKAAKIGLGIHSTSQKLQKLAQLAKRTSMFDDPAGEISELSNLIKQDIEALKTAIAELELLSGTSREANRQSANHSHTVVDNLRTRLKDTTKEFKDILTLRSENLKVHEERRSIFSSSGPSPPMFGAGLQSSLPVRTAAGRATQNPFKGNLQGEASSSGGSHEHTPLLSQQSQLLAPQESTYMNSRAEALQQVESTILELGNIFQQLAHMVQEQGELAVRLDENVDDTLANVEGAQGQLLKYLNSISSNRWLIIRIFMVLAIFLIFFIVFIA